ncbi:hypothetical protein C4577_03610 [Candidatus Parcubacteria bacterium]|nr:MAG: hypothetical protein C4577_03610 [Candidatus Parcubacteria bacterium]
MSFSFITDNTKLKYNKLWSPDFPYCNNCGIITACSRGICTGCQDSVPWDLERTTRLTDIITKDWDIEESTTEY